jgi:hypothetical protein
MQSYQRAARPSLELHNDSMSDIKLGPAGTLARRGVVMSHHIGIDPGTEQRVRLTPAAGNGFVDGSFSPPVPGTGTR